MSIMLPNTAVAGMQEMTCPGESCKMREVDWQWGYWREAVRQRVTICGLKTIGIYCLTVLETSNLKLRCCHDPVPLENSRKDSFMVSASF